MNNTVNFENPDSRFRGLPFWAWNTDVTAEKVSHQVAAFAEMGFGGFIIHARKGLRTPYMGEHFMDMVALAIKEAQKLGLRVWLYDEDGWPSGSVGGKVTVEKKYRQKSLRFTKEKLDCLPKSEAVTCGAPYLLACFNIELDSEGFLSKYELTKDRDGCVRAYVITAPDNPRFNGQAYIDTMNRAAVERFLELTHEKYYARFGEDFGNTVEAIFTDEPQIVRVPPIKSSAIDDTFCAEIPWSDDFDITYKETYGEDIVPHLPEIIFELKDSAPNTRRYRFNAHIADRFENAFSKPIGKWCRDHAIKFTGHYLYEQSLEVQALSLRDVMRNYAHQDIPGIDVLLGGFEFNTALQCRSVKNQSGQNQMMSELYGVTNHTADFRDYVNFGNWQAALGVTERVPHLTWMSMLGEGKRDYPANFGYQAPWYRDFPKIEDHFARLNTVLTSGKPRVSVAVLHPIESHWLIYGPTDKTEELRKARDSHFSALCEWLLFGGFDFDYINEALLPDQFDGKRSVGEMSYDAILIPDCLTLRKTTLDILTKLHQNGVRIIFEGKVPKLVDALPSSLVEDLSKECVCIPADEASVLSALAPFAAFSVSENRKNHIFTERITENERWLFMCYAREITDKESTKTDEYTLTFKGNYLPLIFDTYTAKAKVPEFWQKNGETHIKLSLFSYDSALLRLTEGYGENKPSEKTEAPRRKIEPVSPVCVSRREENVLLLDMAKYSADGVIFSENEEEILRIDTACRDIFGLPLIVGKISPQPWSVCDDIERRVFLRFTFDCEAQTELFLAAEKIAALRFNGEDVKLQPAGYYVDRDIAKYPLPAPKLGKNIIDAEVIISKTVGVEPMYLLGDFEASVGKKISASQRISEFGNVAERGMPFYGGDIEYSLDIDTDEGELLINVPKYRGAFVSVLLDECAVGDVILPPYAVKIPHVSAGKHTVKLVCKGNRHNTFGSLHWNKYDPYCGPMHWHKKGDNFTYSYKLAPFGMLEKPLIFQ